MECCCCDYPIDIGEAFICRKLILSLALVHNKFGGLAQLARVLAWHARGHRFDSDILHKADNTKVEVLSAFCV